MNKSISISALCLILLTASFVSVCTKGENSPNLVSYPIADGTFIQENLVAKWDDAQWQKELGFLKEAGMHYLVFAPTLHTDKDINLTIYPSNLPDVKARYQADLVENCLRNAKLAGFKVFLGLNFNEKWWTASFTPEWLFGQMELGNKVAEELVNRYKSRYDETMYGWYWVWEVDNLNCTTPERQTILANALNINLDHLSEITPGMPFMLCPFMNYRVGNSGDNRKMWTNVFSQTHFRDGDIFAPQDCVGAGGLELGMVDEWFSQMKEAVTTKPGLQFWSDAETFDQRFWTSAPLDRFVEQMKIVKPYVSNIISFAYSHYYSPLQTIPEYHEAYLEYVKTGVLPAKVVPEPVTNLIVFSDAEGKLNLSWKEPKCKEIIAGYYIFKDNKLIANLQYKTADQYITGFKDKNSVNKTACRYEASSYTCSGVASSKSAVEWKNQ
jgi:hypothetical protein